MSQSINNIVILGGGTAGWMTAAILAKQFLNAGPQSNAMTVTLIESSDIPTVGVGEGTWPTMRATLQKIGISETDLINQCDATFKQGSQFVNWHKSSSDNGNNRYFHPFTAPRAFGQFDLSAYWNRDHPVDFASSVSFQPQACELGLAPKCITDKEYQGHANYGYHLDAGKFAELLKNHACQQLGVKHIVDTVEQVNLDHDGAISSLTMQSGIEINGDFFVDCSGFACKLLGDALNIPFVERNDILLTDTALAVHVPYDESESEIQCQTVSTAQESGWVWDIGLSNRRGVGYVYSSKHQNEDDARKTLARYIAQTTENDNSALVARKISFIAGHRKQFFHKNCVAVGLSAGFLEPLEASALMLVEISAEFLANQLPMNTAQLPLVEKRFNQTFLYRWQRIIDFLKLHYALSEREETFWRDSRSTESMPSSLCDLLSLWQNQSPQDFDFDSNFEVFPAASYQYVLYGMGFETDFVTRPNLQTEANKASKLFETNQQALKQLMQRAPKHRDLINKIRTFGLHKV